ncbi:MAG: FeoB-associated Cys-rich membrane protein [Succinivibrio sp.]|nr:FeoB-associated Cys-rich membrane protein [Succinivibrio sp.]
MATALASALIALALALAVWRIIVQKRRGRSISCGQDCGRCAFAPYESSKCQAQGKLRIPSRRK